MVYRLEYNDYKCAIPTRYGANSDRRIPIKFRAIAAPKFNLVSSIIETALAVHLALTGLLRVFRYD
jgi:hypothetical protein